MIDYPGCKHAPLGRDGDGINFNEVQPSANSTPPIHYQIHPVGQNAKSSHKCGAPEIKITLSLTTARSTVSREPVPGAETSAT
jgi:hypothetical protein